MEKFNVGVIARFTADGRIFPKKFQFEDHWFDIEKVIFMQTISSLKTGGNGIRYTCQVEGKRTFMYYENNQWFIDG